jgi:polyisoprenoid-binding protein YceI
MCISAYTGIIIVRFPKNCLFKQMKGIDMKKTFLAYVTGFFILISLVSTAALPGENSSPEHKVNISLVDSKIHLTCTNTDREHTGFAKLTGGELVLDNNEIKGGSFTIDLNSINNKDSKARFEIKKVTKLPLTRTEQGDIKFTHKIEGELTVKGQTRIISFDASVNMLNGKVAAASDAFMIDKDTNLKLDLITD